MIDRYWPYGVPLFLCIWVPFIFSKKKKKKNLSIYNYCIHFTTVDMHAILLYVFMVILMSIKFSQLKHIPRRNLILRKSCNFIQIMLTNIYIEREWFWIVQHELNHIALVISLTKLIQFSREKKKKKKLKTYILYLIVQFQYDMLHFNPSYSLNTQKYNR